MAPAFTNPALCQSLVFTLSENPSSLPDHRSLCGIQGVHFYHPPDIRPLSWDRPCCWSLQICWRNEVLQEARCHFFGPGSGKPAALLCTFFVRNSHPRSPGFIPRTPESLKPSPLPMEMPLRALVYHSVSFVANWEMNSVLLSSHTHQWVPPSSSNAFSYKSVVSFWDSLCGTDLKSAHSKTWKAKLTSKGQAQNFTQPLPFVHW